MGWRHTDLLGVSIPPAAGCRFDRSDTPWGMISIMTHTVDISTLSARHADGAFVLDVREPGVYLAGHVPG